MSADITIALDAMSGDHGADTVIAAALETLKHRNDIRLILVGDQTQLKSRLAQSGRKQPDDRLLIQHASEVVGMDESPSRSLRFKKDSSMRVAIDLVKEGRANACVSAGNTGALMATARYVLKTLPGIDRPAISTAIPSIEGYTQVLDLGANVDCTAEHLFQFAIMGSVLATVHGLDRPRIGLLNIGEEEIKGNDQVKEAARLLSASSLNYTGFVEGDDVFMGGVDVVVCDGFVGNVALKTSEGVAKMISYYMKEAFSRNLFTRMVAAIAMPVLRSFRSRIDPRRYNGASLLGLRGIVIKSHGSADAVAFGNAIDVAVLEVQKDVTNQIDHLLEVLLTERQDG
ncbi:MAG: phosphate acyltransferase PlsX [Gammaproteobacteria bacterium]